MNGDPWGEETEGMAVQKRAGHAPDWRKIADELAMMLKIHREHRSTCTPQCDAALRRYEEARES